MAGKISSKKRQPTLEEKRQRIERNRTEWEENDYDYTVDYCKSLFLVDRMARSSSKSTIDAYDRMFKKLDAHLQQIGGGAKGTPVRWLEQDGAQLFFQMSLGNVSQQTINHYLRSYRAFGKFCEEKGYIDGFTCHIKEVEPPIKEVYTDAELKKLLAKPNKDNFTEYRNYCIVALILATGARSQTIRSIKVKDVDLAEGYIDFNTTKANKVVRLGLEHKVRLDLADYISMYRADCLDSAPLFPSDNLNALDEEQEMTRHGLIKAVANYNKRHGVNKTSIHLLRHTFAKKWITSGGDIITLAKVLTHSELAMVQRYSNLYANDVKDKIEQHSALSQIVRTSGKTIRGSKK